MERRGEQPSRPDYQIILEDFQKAKELLIQENTHGTLYHLGRRAQDLLAELDKPGRFELGRVGWTPGADEVMVRGHHIPAEFLIRHKNGDFGKLDAHDRQVNEEEIRRQGRVLSIYDTSLQETLWVISHIGAQQTELLLPEEY